ncbi:MAG TPA: universal stress protein [Thermodesulfobacteriota bacterium]|nr:universal stress protein [Thermodesulfobacteriota bacterium]
MLPFKKILCPTDFSEPSYEALKTAGELAYHFGSELCIIHVVSPVPPMPTGVEPTAFDVILYEEELMASSKRSLEEVINQLETKEVKARLITLRGDAAGEIVRIADEENMDLIVIATRGRTGSDRLIFGSVAEKVGRLAPCPVLLIRHPQEKGKARPEPKESVPLESEKTLSDIGSLIQKPKEIIFEKKKAYQEKIETQLKEWEPKIDALKTKADKAKTDAQAMYKEQVENLRTKQEAARQKLQELRDSGGEAWEEVKVGLDKAIEDLKQTFNRARSKFREK